MARTDEFYDNGVGHLTNDGRANLGSLSLQQQGQSYTDQVLDAARRPHSVLDPLGFSPNQSENGTSGQNFQPGMGTLGTGNGQSPESYEQSLNLRFLGGDPDAGLG